MLTGWHALTYVQKVEALCGRKAAYVMPCWSVGLLVRTDASDGYGLKTTVYLLPNTHQGLR